MSYEIHNRIYNIRIECIDVFSLSGGCVSDLKQQLEAVRDRMAPIFYKESGYVPTEWAVMNYKAGFNAAIPIILEMAEALEFYSKIENLGKTVWENDVSRDGRCWLEDFDTYEIAEIYGPNATGDYGIKASDAIDKLKQFVDLQMTKSLDEGKI